MQGACYKLFVDGQPCSNYRFLMQATLTLSLQHLQKNVRTFSATSYEYAFWLFGSGTIGAKSLKNQSNKYRAQPTVPFF